VKRGRIPNELRFPQKLDPVMQHGNPIAISHAERGLLPVGEAAVPPSPVAGDRACRHRRALAVLGGRAASPGSPERLMADAAALLAEALDMPLAAAVEIPSDQESLRLRLQPSGEHSPGGPSKTWETSTRANSSLGAYALALGQTVAVTDLASESRFDDTPLRRFGVRAALAIPLMLDGRRLGALAAAAEGPREFREEDLLLAETMGHLVAATLARWHTERCLEEERHLSTGVLETLDAMVLTLDSQWRVLRANPACRRITGRGQEALSGRNFWELFGDADQAELLREFLEEAERDAGPIGSEAALRTDESQDRKIAWSFRKIAPVEGGPCHYVAAGIDVTEQRAAEERARRAEAAAPNAEGRSNAARKAPGADGGGEQQPGPFAVLPGPINIERRRKPRRSYPYSQRIAPILDGKRPDLSDFSEIQCNDIAAGGFSFISDSPPVSDCYVVALGCPPKFTFLTAQIAHVTRVQHEGQRRFLIGCNYAGRVAY